MRMCNPAADARAPLCRALNSASLSLVRALLTLKARERTRSREDRVGRGEEAAELASSFVEWAIQLRKCERRKERGVWMDARMD